MTVMTNLHADQHAAFRADVLDGLAQPRKTLPSRWLYDDRGSELFEQITELPEYYVARTERRILEAHAAQLAAFLGAGVALIEYGAGASVKTERLLGAMTAPAAYVPVDIAGDFLHDAARRIARRFPKLALHPVIADFTRDFALPEALPVRAPRAAFFPGSTLGNLDAPAAAAFLARAGGHVGAGGAMILGADLFKSADILIPAYDDAAGVTAAFNLNLLERMNRELDAAFDLATFRHEARWNAARSAVEMHLVSTEAQTVPVAGRPVTFAAGESIHTEDSRKYTLDALEGLAQAAGWQVEHVWQDEAALFGVLGLRYGRAARA